MNSAEKKIIIPETAIPRPDQLESNKQLIIKTNSSKGFLGYLLYGNS